MMIGSMLVQTALKCNLTSVNLISCRVHIRDVYLLVQVSIACHYHQNNHATHAQRVHILYI